MRLRKIIAEFKDPQDDRNYTIDEPLTPSHETEIEPAYPDETDDPEPELDKLSPVDEPAADWFDVLPPTEQEPQQPQPGSKIPSADQLWHRTRQRRTPAPPETIEKFLPQLARVSPSYLIDSSLDNHIRNYTLSGIFDYEDAQNVYRANHGYETLNGPVLKLVMSDSPGAYHHEIFDMNDFYSPMYVRIGYNYQFPNGFGYNGLVVPEIASIWGAGATKEDMDIVIPSFTKQLYEQGYITPNAVIVGDGRADFAKNILNSGQMEMERDEEAIELTRLQTMLHLGADEFGNRLDAGQRAAIRQKLGLDDEESPPSIHPWQKALQDRGYLTPGRKWWAMHSDEKHYKFRPIE